MTNRQLAAARRAHRQFPDVRIEKDGSVLTPIRNGQRGAPLIVTDTMQPHQVEQGLRSICAALNG